MLCLVVVLGYLRLFLSLFGAGVGWGVIVVLCCVFGVVIRLVLLGLLGLLLWCVLFIRWLCVGVLFCGLCGCGVACSGGGVCVGYLVTGCVCGC